MYRGIATFTLDYGHCPPWLFERMVKLGRAVTEIVIEEYGPDEFIKRIADPVWFQSLGTVLAFDWNSSGLTTILTAALKEAIRGQEKDLGIFVCGGKGKTSRKTPDEIISWGERLNLPQASTQSLVYNSKMSAKVDSSLVQDGYQIYHHSFFFSSPPAPVPSGTGPADPVPSGDRAGGGAWAVVQQGMNTQSQTARRYHWYSESLEDLVCEPHSGIVAQMRMPTLNLTAIESTQTRQLSTQLVSENSQTLQKDIQIIRKHSSSLSKMVSLLQLADIEFKNHPVEWENFWNSPYLDKILKRLAETKPENYEVLLSQHGVGPKTIRALSLVAEVIYGAKPSYEDPARYSFAHGGKDKTPYPVDRKTYDQTIEILADVVYKSKISSIEKDQAFRRLYQR